MAKFVLQKNDLSVDSPSYIEGNVEHPEEGSQVEVVHDDGQGKAGLSTHIS
jgi:hypothetical protein